MSGISYYLFALFLADVDPPPTCPTCRGGGRLRTGFGDRTEPCSQCGGTATV